MPNYFNADTLRIFQRPAVVLLITAIIAGASICCGETGSKWPGIGSDAGVFPANALVTASDNDRNKSSQSTGTAGKSGQDKIWKSEDLDILAVGMAIGDVDGDGKKEIVIVDPSTVYIYRMTPERNLVKVCEYSEQALEFKSVDVGQFRKQGPCRIYVSAQNRGAVQSLVLEYRAGALVPVITNIQYFLRVIDYPTKGQFLLGQRKGLTRIYDGPIFNMADKGDELEAQGRFGVPLKIPIFGFAIGDLEGKQRPLIAVYDRQEHLRIYDPSGKRLFISQEFYGGSDVILRQVGPEIRKESLKNVLEVEKEFFRPRILARDLKKNSVYEVLAISHFSKTRRLLSQTKMLEEGKIVGLTWNGDALTEAWSTPKVQGMITDFAVDSVPGFQGDCLITLERKKTDWLAFLRSKSQIRIYDLQTLMAEGSRRSNKED